MCSKRAWVKVHLQQTNDAVKPGLGAAVLTSEANAYGLGWGRWFDGKVDILSMNSFSRQCSHKFLIKEVNEYQLKGWGCSDESYYECLGRRFDKRNISLQNVWCKNGGGCKIGGDEPSWQGEQVGHPLFLCIFNAWGYDIISKKSGYDPVLRLGNHLPFGEKLCAQK